MATYDAQGREIGPDGQPVKTPGRIAFMGDDTNLGYNANDLTRAQNQGAEQAGVAAGIGALGSLAQFGLTAIDTKQDRYDKKRLATLEATEKAGHLGLTGAERQQADATLMAPVRALASENRNRAEASVAAMGGASAADLARVRRNSEEATNDAALKAGTEIERENLSAAAAQRQEMEERRSYESSRARQRIEMIGQTLSGLAKEAGPVLAASAVKTPPTDAQFIAMKQAKNADGTPVYPGYQSTSVDQMRADWQAQMAGTRKGRPDNATIPLSTVP